MFILKTAIVLAAIILCFFVFMRIITYLRIKQNRAILNAPNSPIIGFFHPAADACGGGEKVLFNAISALQSSIENEKIKIVVYSGSLKPKQDIFKLVKERFSINLDASETYFVQLQTHKWMEPHHYPRLTMFMQILAFQVTCFEAMTKFPCDVFVDTVGVGFAYPLVKILFGVKVVSYTHYPTISNDMLKQTKISQFNNKQTGIFSKLKRIYYRILIKLYTQCGRFGDQHATNSSWTHNHITQMWGTKNVTKIYPPCDTNDIINQISLDGQRQNILVSFAQFRPEKDHQLQLRVWSQAIQQIPKNSKFYLIGATRGLDDEAIVDSLKDLAEKLQITNSIEFFINQPRQAIIDLFKTAKVAIHTMKEEHFGISIVEMMAAGLIVIAHASAGPKMDIIGGCKEHVGYLAHDESTYTKLVINAMNNYNDQEHKNMRKEARTHIVEEFGIEQFERKFVKMIKSALK